MILKGVDFPRAAICSLSPVFRIQVVESFSGRRSFHLPQNTFAQTTLSSFQVFDTIFILFSFLRKIRVFIQ